MSEQRGTILPPDDSCDPRIARLYRDAAREEPPPHLDDALLAAARREVRAELCVPDADGAASGTAAARARGWRRRRGVSLAAAAVLVLSVSLVMLGTEYPRIGDDAAPAGEERGTPGLSARAPDNTESAKRFIPEKAPPAPTPALAMKQETAREDADPASPPLAQRRSEPQRSFDDLRGPEEHSATSMAQNAVASRLSGEPPEKWGEEIVRLRRVGHAREADVLLAEFRRRFPGYAIPDEWTGQ